MQNICDRLMSLIGRNVVVEGTFPIPISPGKVAYAPAKGKLVAVYADGFDILEEGDTEAVTFNMLNVRSVQPVSEIARPTAAGRGLIS